MINPERTADAAAIAHEIRNEFVLQAEGEVVLRAPDAVNPNLPTGEIEIQVDTLTIVSRSEPLPFQIGGGRRRGAAPPVPLPRHAQRAHAAQPAPEPHDDQRDPSRRWTSSTSSTSGRRAMTKGTPEGARDFLVPVRLQPGKFFALAQSPQLFKQLCMVGGLDRYYQIATCWRDEDLRADRQFEFRQLDLEMSFVDREDVLDVLEAAVVASFEALGRSAPARPFPRLIYADAMRRYGTDKPDLRFGLEIQDATELTRDSEFGVFAKAPVVRYLVGAAGVLPRRARRGSRRSRRSGGRRGLPTSSTTTARSARRSRSSSPSRSSLRSAASPARPCSSSPTRRGARRARARRPAHAPRPRARARRGRSADAFHWVIDFPLFERDEDTRPAGRSSTIRSPRAIARRRGPDVESTRAACSASTTTWSGTAGSWARARSGSTDAELQAGGLPDDGPRRGGAAGEVRLPARRPPDGRSAARRLRDGHRPFRRPHGRRARYPPGDRVPEGLERRAIRSPGAPTPMPDAVLARARNPIDRRPGIKRRQLTSR